MVAAQGGPRFALVGGSFTDTNATPLNPQVNYALSNAGVESWSSTYSGGATLGNWVTPTSLAGANYEARATVVSGVTPSGSATGTWLALNTSRQWTVGRGSVGTDTTQLTIEIRNASTLSVLVTQTVNLTATMTL